MIRRNAGLLTAVFLAACTDASQKAADTAKAATDSTAASVNTQRPRPNLKLEKPDTSASVGEIVNAPTIMREDSKPARPRDKDPLPNVIGETRKSGGTMKPLPPHDSAFGPKIGIDKNGNPVPIKKN